ncbi:MAG TPA: LamG-like jellyroll fold domain-containing protein [Thermoguttaceae bacterium]|nr:LamG-like jellyroll fold domain-containing protein [Thermoguttaceae bacterium]
MRISITTLVLGLLAVLWLGTASREVSGASGSRPSAGAEKVFRAGASCVDITPKQLPAVVSGGFLERTAGEVKDPLHARALVLDDGATRLAICVVDTLLMPRDLVDKAKGIAEEATGIPTDRMLVAATHTHCAPSVVGALGTGVDENYTSLLPGWIAQAIRLAAKNLAPARVGWNVASAPDHTNCRRWILRPDRVGMDPFGGRTVRAMMHPGYQNPDYVGPAGPDDPGLSVLSVQSPAGRPVALLANFSMHYYGAAPISADYYGRFCRMIAERIGADELDPPFVGIMSQGTSGDLHWMDYSRPAKPRSIDKYAQEMADMAYEAYTKIDYHDWVPLAMAETTLTLKRRTPDRARLAWAKRTVDALEGRKPTSHPEVYAREQVFLHEDPVRELKLQAVRVGELGMAAIPSEVYGITGLKIKAQSPLQPTFNYELANGAEGYIPPPEQHFLGGYTTWPARSAGLEVEAEPKIVDTVLSLLEKVAGRPRRKPVDPLGPYAKAVLDSKPVAYWRLNELAGPQAADVSGRASPGVYGPGVAFHLEGPQSPGFCGAGHVNRAAHFAGGRMKAELAELGSQYSVELWFWNGMPVDARAVTGYLFSRGVDGAKGAPGDHLGIGGKHEETGAAGKLFFCNGDDLQQVLVGTTEIELRTWNHVVLVRDGHQVAVYLNGRTDPELAGQVAPGCPPDVTRLFLGGRNDNLFNFEGKIDEVALYNRPLTVQEAAGHFAAAKEK